MNEKDKYEIKVFIEEHLSFDIIDVSELTDCEKNIYNKTKDILSWLCLSDLITGEMFELVLKFNKEGV